MVNPVLLIVVPLGLAFLTPLFGLASKKTAKYFPVAGMLFNLMLSFLLLGAAMNVPVIVKIGGFAPPFGINLTAGPVGAVLSLLIAFVGFLVSVYAIFYPAAGDEVKYHTLFLLLLTGATGAVLTGDIFNLFVFYEILCVSSYALVASLGNRDGVESAVKYLIQGSIGSGLVLIGVALLYGMFGTLNMADIASQAHTVGAAALFIPLGLLITGFGVEAAVFPLNAWLPDAHSSAPSPISAILSGIAIKVGIYAVARMVFTLFGASNMFLFLVFLGLVTLLIGEMSAFVQNNIKRLLAYSSLGQVGLIVFALGIATSSGVAGGMFQIISHALSKSLLFMGIGYMIYRTGSMEISSLEGMGRKMPVTSLACAVAAFSLVGLPPFAGFPSKFMIVRAALGRGELMYVLLTGLVLAGTVIEGAYFFRIVQVLFFKEGEGSSAGQEAPLGVLIPLCVLALAILALGVYPDVVRPVLDAAASELLDRLAYIKGVLG